MNKPFFVLAFVVLWLEICAVSLDHVIRYLPKNPIVLEAGSYNGHDTAILASTFPEGIVHAFEPIPEYYTMLTNKFNGCFNIRLYPLALNTFSGSAVFYYNRINPGSSSLLPSTEEFKYAYTDDPIRIECITLQKWMNINKIDHIDLMWLDMEGMEYQVLSSYPQILDKVSCVIIEVNYLEFRQGMSMHFQMEKIFKAYDFVCVHIEGEKTQNDQVWVKKRLL